MMGIIADHGGYYTAFGIMGVAVLGIGVLLLLTTPAKLRLPQAELASLK